MSAEAAPTIYVSIAAYRDPELVPTVHDCLARAAQPGRLRIGICWQHGPEEGPLPWLDDPRFRIIDVPWQASQGACWARSELMKRYEGEQYYLQLDSHHRFADGWDDAVIAELARTGSPKPLLTAYVTPFDPGQRDRSHEPMQMNFDRFTEDGIPLFRPGAMRDWQRRNRPQPARFLSAHFLFTSGQFVREVPYDSDLYFIGEEITLAVRAFTHGYDLFHPTSVVVWHEYTREHRPHKHWTDHGHGQGVDVAWYERDRVSLDKVKRFLDSPQAGAHGLGTVRTVAQYEAFAGIDFRRRRVQPYTRQGLDPPNPPVEDGWADKIKCYSVELTVDKRRLPAGVSDYSFWYVGVHDAERREIGRQDADRHEVARLLSGDEPAAIVRRTFDTDREPASWTVWPVSESRGWLEKIEGPICPQPSGVHRDT